MTKVSSKLAASVSKARKPATVKPVDLPIAAQPAELIQDKALAAQATTPKTASELHPARVWPD
jgi:hypothetical protein